jgi:hypothetical protein
MAKEEARVFRLLKDTNSHFRLFLLILVLVIVLVISSGGARGWRGLVGNHGLVIILIQGGDAEAAKPLGAGFHSRRR